ncbi:retrovirus-related pol polyprotein from transposon TNT 1-94 [Tanacetum coccineum]
MAIPVTTDPSNSNPNNNINDPLHLASSDHPRMVLTNTPFNGGNFLGWSRNVKMALGVKLKLGFIDGSCPKPAITDENVQRWVRCDYMVTCWILKSMVTELSVAFLYAQSAYELWNEIAEIYGQSNGPLIYQLERELSKITHGNLGIAAFFNKLKRCRDELQNLNGLSVCNCGKMQECTCAVFDKFLERDSHLKLIQFLMKLNDEYEFVRSQILAIDPLPNVNKAYYIVQQIEKQKQVTNHSFDPSVFFTNTNNRQNSSARRDVKQPRTDNRSDQKRSCTNCRQDGHVFDQFCFEMMKMFKGKGIADESGGPMRNYASISSHAGASDHMTPHFQLFISIRYLTHPIMVHLPDGRSLKVTIVGEVALTQSLILSDVFYDLTTREIVAFGKGSMCLYICKPVSDPDVFDTNIAEFHQSHKHLVPSYVFNKTAFSNAINTKSCLDIQTFHDRLGHTSVSKLVHIPECKQFDVSNFHCESCMLSKQHRLPFPIGTSIQSIPFALLHMDLWGPYKKPALNGAHYFFNIVDDRTRATWTYLIHRKDQISDLLDTFLAYVDNHFKAKPKYIRSDNVERKHRHLLETARSLRIHANLSLKFWGECVLAATYLINKMPMKKLNWKSPYEVLFGKPPDFSHLRTIRCLCYAALTRPHKDKFENKGVKCVLIGYPSNQKGYQLYNLNTQEVFLSRDVILEENFFPFKTPIEVIPMTFKLEYPSFEECSTIEEPLTFNIQHVQLDPNTPSDIDFVTPKHTNSSTAFGSTQPLYPLFGKNYFSGLPSSHIVFLANVFALTEPNSYQEAIKDKGLVEAMNKELDALGRNHTWDLTTLPAGHKPITSKWVFKIKYKSDGTLERLKARLVVRGFNQKEGQDYKHTFSTVAKLATVRVLIALATTKEWDVHQLDINNAFLHGYIDEEIYMLPPKGYSKAAPNQVCKLTRSLYGLKQASRQWNQELTKFLLSLGYAQSKHDYSLFVKNINGQFTAALVYVDDVLITGNNSAKILSLKQALHQKFTIKDLGLAKYFLGIELCRTKAGTYLNQRKYILDLLSDAGLTAAKPKEFPLPTQLKLSLTKGTPLRDPGSYRRLVGRLLYLTMTRRDISYVVQHLSQFVSSPKDVHMQAALHLLKYLKGTQAIVSRSSTEAEYKSMAATTCELLWLSYLLKDLQIHVHILVTLFCDNKSAQQIAANPCYHDRTKHLDIDCHFTRDKVQDGFLQTAYIPTQSQIADIMTKALGKLQHSYLSHKLGLAESPT